MVLPGTAWAAPGRKRDERRPYFVLDPEYGRGRRCNVRERRKPDNCHGCKACHNHGKNKMFATRRAADRKRAHKGCKCKVVKGGTLDVKTWEALFGGGKRLSRVEVDRRNKRTKTILRSARRRARARQIELRRRRRARARA